MQSIIYKLKRRLWELWGKVNQKPTSLVISTLTILTTLNLIGYFSLYSFKTAFPPVDVVSTLSTDELKGQASIIHGFLVDTYLRNEQFYLDNMGNLTITVQPYWKFSRDYSEIEYLEGYIKFNDSQTVLKTHKIANEVIGSILKMNFNFDVFKLSDIEGFEEFSNQNNYLYPKNVYVQGFTKVWSIIHITNFIILVSSVCLVLGLIFIWIDNYISQLILTGILVLSTFIIIGAQVFQIVVLIIYETKLHDDKFIQKLVLLIAVFLANGYNCFNIFNKIIDYSKPNRNYIKAMWLNDSFVDRQPYKPESPKSISSVPITVPTVRTGSPLCSARITKHPYPSSVYPESIFNEHIDSNETDSMHFSNPMILTNKSAITFDPNDSPRPTLDSKAIQYSGHIKYPQSSQIDSHRLPPLYQPLTAPVGGFERDTRISSPETMSSGFEQLKNSFKPKDLKLDSPNEDLSSQHGPTNETLATIKDTKSVMPLVSPKIRSPKLQSPKSPSNNS